MNFLRRWWDRQNERDAFKKGMIAFSKHCVAAVKHHVPQATRVRARAIWYGDQTRARVVWTDGSGRTWQWPLYLPFSCVPEGARTARGHHRAFVARIAESARRYRG